MPKACGDGRPEVGFGPPYATARQSAQVAARLRSCRSLGLLGTAHRVAGQAPSAGGRARAAGVTAREVACDACQDAASDARVAAAGKIGQHRCCCRSGVAVANGGTGTLGIGRAHQAVLPVDVGRVAGRSGSRIAMCSHRRSARGRAWGSGPTPRSVLTSVAHPGCSLHPLDSSECRDVPSATPSRYPRRNLLPIRRRPAPVCGRVWLGRRNEWTSVGGCLTAPSAEPSPRS